MLGVLLGGASVEKRRSVVGGGDHMGGEEGAGDGGVDGDHVWGDVEGGDDDVDLRAGDGAGCETAAKVNLGAEEGAGEVGDKTADGVVAAVPVAADAAGEEVVEVGKEVGEEGAGVGEGAVGAVEGASW